MTGANLIEISDLAVEFQVNQGVVRAVDGVSFRVPANKTVALVGESGSGKSVVSQAIMGILPANGRITRGSILFNDPATSGAAIDIARLDTDGKEMRGLRGGRISIIFQEPMTSLSALHTVGDQIEEALHLHRDVPRAEGHRLTVDMLRRVGFPDPERTTHAFPFELSGGLRQRAMIAMALVCRPALLIADEPTTALDVTIQAQILQLIRELQGTLSMAVLLITHDLGVVANMADEIVVLYGGRVVERGTLDDIFRAPAHPYLNALLRAVPRFNRKPGERLTPIRAVESQIGALLKSKPPAPAAGAGDAVLLEVEGLSKHFVGRGSGLFAGGPKRRVTAVDDVSFSIRRGECLGLVGESGCGKTTVSKLILRAYPADAGSVRFHDGAGMVDVPSLTGPALLAYRRKVQFVFQDPYASLNPRMNIFDVICEPLLIHEIGDRDERFERVKELMALVGLDVRHMRRYPHSFSGGQRQRIGIARALALQPALLICDEPVSALDVSIQAQVLNLLKDLQTELGLTYLFISHNLAVVDYMADRIAVMCAGRVVETAARQELFRNPVHPYTKALLAAVPHPDPSAKLDLSALMDGRASNPADWPAPFTLGGSLRPRLVDIGGGHHVRTAAARLEDAR